ncbi:multidrug resistance protein, MATE family [Angomonas deanei]|uniref:MatE, putative n=1 Tax=Angomonas deanei TaxID=59799 RepID=A0A7G2CD86_9TRYP|nr:multidrug resistance protein, MATE family [Angomonas deanei]CAD2216673.1 MatE, putative [Angomonas deanei]|eukprot:EPY26431.1 multidrug resistance protein, MATE family [Angomonas deanei]
MVGVEQLGATSLAFGLLYCTAMSLASGCSGALETMLSYTFGKNPNSKLFGVYTQRMLLLLLIIAFVVGPFLAFSDIFLIAIHQDPTVAHYTGVFCRTALIGVFPAMSLEVVRRYFACQHLNNPLSVNLVAAALVFPFMVYGLISAFGFVGAPLAWSLLQIIMPTSLVVYMYVTKIYKRTWGGWDKSAIRNWGPLCKLAFPSMAMQLSEWGSLEVNCVTAGFATPPQLAAFSTVYMLSGILWSFSSGLYIMVSVLVGKSIGEGNSLLGRRCALICLFFTICFGILDNVILVTLRHQIPRLFTDNEEALATFPTLLPFFCVYHVFDLIQSCMMGVLRGCGMQSLGRSRSHWCFRLLAYRWALLSSSRQRWGWPPSGWAPRWV